MLNELMHFEFSMSHKTTNIACKPLKGKRLNLSKFCFDRKLIDRMGIWFPTANRNVLLQLTLFIVRSLILLLYISEGSSMHRTLFIVLVFMLTYFRKCILQLGRNNPVFNRWNALQILFVISNHFWLSVSAIYVGVGFYVVVVCATISVVALGTLHLTSYVIFAIVGIVIFIVSDTMFYLCVNVGEESQKLKHKWLLFCGTA